MPSYGHSDSLVVFVSNRSGIDNIYLNVTLPDSSAEYPLTNVLAGCFTPSWSTDGKLLAFTIFEQGGWDIFLMKDPLSKKINQPLPKTHFMKTLEDTSLSFFRPVNWENLSSYMKDTAASDEKATASKADKMNVKKDSLASAVDTIPAADTLSIKSDTIPMDTQTSVSSIDTVPLLGDSASLADSLPAKTDTMTLKSKKALFEDDEDEYIHLDTVAMDKTPRNTKHLLDSTEYLDENGLFRKKRYKPVFSLDVAAAALGVSNFDGSFGQGYVVLTDLMGDQEILILMTLAGNITENSMFDIQYHYKPYRTDFIIGGFYRAFDSEWSIGGKEMSYGGRGAVLYPLSIFTRWQFNVITQYISREKDIYYYSVDTVLNQVFIDSIIPVSNEKGIFYPSLSWSHDNAQWGISGPINGKRINARFSMVPPLLEKDIFFMIGDLDFRKYWRFAKKYTVAFRANGGFSEPIGGKRNPHRYLLGGDDFINIYPFNLRTSNLPDEIDIEGLFFTEFALPLRGYPYFEFSGNRKALFNLEFRYPFIKELSIVWPLPLRIRHVTGVIFTDYGMAWTYSQPHYFHDERGEKYRSEVEDEYNHKMVLYNQARLAGDTTVQEPTYPEHWPLEPREIFEDNQGWTWGFGLRLNLGIFVLRWTRAFAIDGIGNHKKSKTHYWSLGAEF
jgi:hypothetical protein